MLCIFTDGACSTKTRIGGWGFQVIDCDHIEEFIAIRSGAKTDTTNNEMELTAFYEALKWVETILINEPVSIYSDSAYIVNCFQDKWYEKWQKNGWLTANKTPVKHKELWIKIFDTLEKLRYKEPYNGLKLAVLKIDAHSGHPGNDAADKLAVDAKEALAAKKG